MGIKNRFLKKYNNDGAVGMFFSVVLRPFIFIRGRLAVFFMRKSMPVFGLNQTEPRDRKVIVSLTSYPARFATLHLCIKSLLRQTYKPDKIILYLGDDSDETQISEEIKQLIPYGLELAFRPDNLKPHKKYFYAMQEYPTDIVITVDDDLIHRKSLILSLVKSYRRYPNAISSGRVHKMMTDDAGKIAKYSNFKLEYRAEQLLSMQLLATGGAGTLYPPGCLSQEAFDAELIKKLCLTADDIWLKFMEVKNNFPVVWVYSGRIRGSLINIPDTQGTALYNKNKNDAEGNDMFISRLEEYFSVNLADYCGK